MPRLEHPENYKRAGKTAILKAACDAVTDELHRSLVLDEEAQQQLPRFDTSELSLGRVLGRGGFCVVREINAVKLKNAGGGDPRRMSWAYGGRKGAGSTRTGLSGQASTRTGLTVQSTTNAGELSSREYLARKIWSKRGVKYVVKQVEPDLIHTDRITFLKGTIDLVLETSYLASLQHQHILSIKGMAIESPFEQLGYFIILEQLPEILSKRLNTWMHAVRASKGVTGFLTGGKKRMKGLLLERILVAYDVAEAMDYLHGKRIIYRDLKPDNIGFDVDGTVKIFDFGLAKELLENDRDHNGLYKLTGFTGAIRYMAPEVGLKCPYNLKADVYSWSMLMWYMMALEPPMGMYTPNMFIERVFRKGYRPATNVKWPERLCALMKACWSEDEQDRPNFKGVMLTLRRVVEMEDAQIASFMGDAPKESSGSRMDL